MKVIIYAFAMLVLTGCASGYSQFYNPYVDAKMLPDVELIGPNEEPKVFASDNIDRDIQTLVSKRYIVVGYSSFNGEYEDVKNAAEQAKKIGATIVLTNSVYTDTQSSTSALLVPNTQSTLAGTTAVPFTTHQRRHDQVAVYLVKSNKKFKFGIFIDDITPEIRSEIERNTGALIMAVVEDTPAFNSNIIAGDVLIAIDGKPIRDAKQALEHMTDITEEQSHSEFLVIRKGEEKAIQVKL